MISKETFDIVKSKYGHFASWAVWADEGLKPKDNVGDLSVFDITKNPDLLSTLKTDLVLVGLNISRQIVSPLANFHDSKSKAMDYKIRYALKDTRFWGAYMTDIIKDFEHISSGNVRRYLQKNRAFELKNVELFREELLSIGSVNPTIVAFGTDAYSVIERYIRSEIIKVPHLIKVPHFSNYTGREKYRKEVLSVISSNYDIRSK